MSYTRFIDTIATDSNGDAMAVDTSAYADGDVVGGLLQFSLGTAVISGVILNGAKLIDDDSEGAALRLYLFARTSTADSATSTAVSSIADNAAFAPTIGDLKKLVAVIDFSTYVTVNSNDYAFGSITPGSNRTIASNDGKLYGYLVTNGSTPTYTAATDLMLQLNLVSEQ